MHTFDISLEHLTKVEGSAALDVSVKNGKVTDVRFRITEYKRFFTEAMKGKPLGAIPQHLARICGTCSNAHLICAIEAGEDALGVVPSKQTQVLRALTMHGLIIRDHALHLYLFVLPDMYNKDSFLDFDENNEEEHQHLHDAFDIKAAGNYLATLIAGRSVHAINPVIGGFLKFPDEKGVAEAVEKLKKIRPAVLRCVETFKNTPFSFDRKTDFMALVPDESFGYIGGKIINGKGDVFERKDYHNHLEHVVLPYSQASAYSYKGESYMVGSLARLNLAKEKLHSATRESLGDTLNVFPSTDIHLNNLAQAVEILHSVDESLELLTTQSFEKEEVIKAAPKASVGIGVVEAPRGTLYHKVVIDDKGTVTEGEVVVPTGQNQLNIEQDVGRLVEELIPKMEKDQIAFEIEKLIRAYDPCMSCASHFLKVNWKEE